MPNKFQSILQKLIGIQKQSSLNNTSKKEDIAFTVPGAYGQAEPAGLSKRSQIEAYYYSWVNFCVRKIASNIANINLRLLKKTGDKIEEVPEHAVIDLLERGNDVMTFYDLVEHYSILTETAGECFWWLWRNESGEIMKIFPWLSPAQMDVVPGKENFVDGYIYNEPGTSEQIPFTPDEIIHFKYTDPLNPYRGLSTVRAAELAIATDRESAKWNWRFFKNSARPDVAISVENTLTKTQYDRIHAQWNAAHQGTENAHKLTILEGGAKISTPLGINQKDMDFLAQRKFSREEILMVFGIPIGLVVSESSNRAVAETAKAVFIEETVEPKMKKFVSFLNEFLLPQYDDTEDMYFDYKDPTIKNTEQVISYYENAIKNGWMSINEVRVLEGLELVEGANSLYLPLNVQPIAETKPIKMIKPQVSRKRRTKTQRHKDIIKKEFGKLGKDKLEKVLKVMEKKKGVAKINKQVKKQVKKKKRLALQDSLNDIRKHIGSG